ncbi:hypothetical protein D9M68_795260 [compost metagenome]
MTTNLAAGLAKLGVDHGVAARQLHLHVVDDGVHLRHGVALGLQLLAGELERHAAGRVELAGDELQFGQQPYRSAGVVVAGLAGLGAQDVRH